MTTQTKAADLLKGVTVDPETAAKVRKPAPKPTPKPQTKTEPKPKAQPKPKPATLGQSGYRAKFGLTDAQMLKAILQYADTHEGWDAVKGMSDADILEEIGWATSLAGALKKLRPLYQGAVADVRADVQATEH